MPGKLSNSEKAFLSQFNFKDSSLGHHQMVFYEGCLYETTENKFRFAGWYNHQQLEGVKIVLHMKMNASTTTSQSSI